MKELRPVVEVVRDSALRGARSVTSRKQFVEDAVLQTLVQWEEAVLKGKKIGDLERWAFRVAANAAKRSHGAKHVGVVGLLELGAGSGGGSDEGSDSRSDVAGLRAVLPTQLCRKKNLLRGRQLEILLKLAQPGMTQNRAARELGMDPSNLRRTFRSGLARLKKL